jgi:hypothetical protein
VHLAEHAQRLFRKVACRMCDVPSKLFETRATYRREESTAAHFVGFESGTGPRALRSAFSVKSVVSETGSG